MPSSVDQRASDVQVAAHFWDHHHSNAEDPRFWMAHPLCRAAINRRVTRSPDEWPLEWFARVFGGHIVALLMAELDPAVEPGADLDVFIAKWLDRLLTPET